MAASLPPGCRGGDANCDANCDGSTFGPRRITQLISGTTKVLPLISEARSPSRGEDASGCHGPGLSSRLVMGLPRLCDACDRLGMRWANNCSSKASIFLSFSASNCCSLSKATSRSLSWAS